MFALIGAKKEKKKKQKQTVLSRGWKSSPGKKETWGNKLSLWVGYKPHLEKHTFKVASSYKEMNKGLTRKLKKQYWELWFKKYNIIWMNIKLFVHTSSLSALKADLNLLVNSYVFNNS